MGDRGVIEVRGKDNEPSIYFYTHWLAYELPILAAKGLEAGKPRWGDESYLNRIIFDTLTGLSGGETGFGIATWCPTDAYVKVIINHDTQTVTLSARGVSDEWQDGTERSFEEYLAFVASEGVERLPS